MKIKEEKICSFTQKGTRLQLVRLIIPSQNRYYQPKTKTYKCYIEKFQVRLNRKIISTYYAEYTARKVFATYAQNIVLQLKIY